VLNEETETPLLNVQVVPEQLTPGPLKVKEPEAPLIAVTTNPFCGYAPTRSAVGYV
jgi:hypothetical protein